MKDIKNYEGLYAITEDGKVWSYKRKKFLKPGNCRGYVKINLYKDDKPARYFVHRLVAQAYLENPDNLPEVNHKDRDKTNNSVSNLEWVSPKANSAHSNTKAVYCIELDKVFNSLTEAVIELDLTYSGISLCLTGRRKSTGGYHFTYA